MSKKKRFPDQSFAKDIEKNIEKSVEKFLGKYSSLKFADYFVACHDYFIDCYELYCPDGCDRKCPDYLGSITFQPLPREGEHPGDVRGLIPLPPTPFQSAAQKRIMPDISWKTAQRHYFDSVKASVLPPLPKPGEFPTEMREFKPTVQLKRRECPRKEKRVDMRVRIGDLTENEVKFLGITCRNAYALCVFRRATDISLETLEEKRKHSELLEKFATARATERQNLSWQQRLQITSAMSMVKLASELRATRKRAWGYSLTVGNIPGLPVENMPDIPIEQLLSAPPTKTRKKQVKRVDPKPQNPTKGTINDALMALFHKKPKAVHWTAERLAEELTTRRKDPIKRCTASGVKATLAWFTYCKPLRRREKTVSWEDAGQIEDNQSDQNDQDEPSEQSETGED